MSLMTKSPTKLLASLVLSMSLIFMPTLSSAKIPTSMLTQNTPSLAPMLSQVTPAVVSISVAGSKTVNQQVPEAFRYFFGQRRGMQPREQPFQGLGSGVIINADQGYIVTNYHVIDQADQIKITLKDGREFMAKKIGGDDQSDLALLQIEADNLVEIAIADSDKLQVGDFTVAIGNPFGLSQTVTSGIISALGRAELNIEGYEDFIQTDAAINSGNSGGALINLKGELIGINTAIYAPGGGNVGIAFSIPSNMMNSVVNQIIDFGEVRRGVLGIVGRAVSSQLAESLDLAVSQGAFIQSVVEDSAADEADLQAGDVIISINGVKIKGFGELASKIATLGAGTQVELGVLRDNKQRLITVTLKAADVVGNMEGTRLIPQLAGATFINDKTGDGTPGIMVEALDDRSPAAATGLEVGDVIIGVNRRAVQDLKQLREALNSTSGLIALNIRRGRSSLYLVIR